MEQFEQAFAKYRHTDYGIAVAKKHNLLLIEDAAHAHGTEWRGTKIGAIGDFGSFSFQLSKSLTAGEGGIVLTNNVKLAEKAYLIHDFGRKMGAPSYLHFLLSSNYRMTEFQGALLLSQMKHLPEWTELKHRNGEYLATELGKIGGIEPLKRDARITKRVEPIPDYQRLFLPVAEEFCAHQQITIAHPVLMVDRPGIQMIVDSIAKIKNNIDELIE